MPQLRIKLPCTADKLTEAIRGFCERHDGRYDLAKVDVVDFQDANSFYKIFELKVTLPEWLANNGK